MHVECVKYCFRVTCWLSVFEGNGHWLSVLGDV